MTEYFFVALLAFLFNATTLGNVGNGVGSRFSFDQAMADLEAVRSIPLDEAKRRFDEKYDLPNLSDGHQHSTTWTPSSEIWH